MIKAIRYLSLLLVVQLAVIAGVHLSARESDTLQMSSLLDVDYSGVDRIVVSDSEHSTELERDGDQWQLANYGNLPAAANKVPELLDRLQALKVSWPVASSGSAAERFEVATDNAQKTVAFFSDGKPEATLYLGTSPGYRKIHARVDGSDDIYVVELAQHQLPATSADWMDKTVLQVKGSITQVKSDPLNFTASAGSEADSFNWNLAELPPGTTLDNEAAATWVKRFNNLLVNQLVNDPASAEKIVIQNPLFTVNVAGEGFSDDFAFYKADDKYYVKKFGDQPLYEIASYQAEAIVNASPEDFVAKADTADEAERSQAVDTDPLGSLQSPGD